MTLGGRVHVRAPWHARRARARRRPHRPRPAFGTERDDTDVPGAAARSAGGGGGHLGCGSGVLAIAAAKLGFGPVLGVDHDPLAIDATHDNARINRVDVDARRYDLIRDGPAPAAPTVLANLLGPLLRRLAGRLRDGVRPAGADRERAAATEADEIAAAFARRGLAERSRRTDGEWAALLLAAPP